MLSKRRAIRITKHWYGVITTNEKKQSLKSVSTKHMIILIIKLNRKILKASYKVAKQLL